MAARARTREVLRPDRPPKANARSPPDRMACFSSPAPRWLLGSRTVVLLALLVIYNDVLYMLHRVMHTVARARGGRGHTGASLCDTASRGHIYCCETPGDPHLGPCPHSCSPSAGDAPGSHMHMYVCMLCFGTVPMRVLGLNGHGYNICFRPSVHRWYDRSR
jgi:hypothetical protein